MSEILFKLLIHHGGRFNGNKRRYYIGGKVTMVCEDLDIDKISYPEIMSYIKEDLEYELESIAGLYYYKIPQGDFVLVQDDHTILSIVSKLCNGAHLEFYVDHNNCENHITLPLEIEVTEVRDKNQSLEDFVDGAILESQIDDLDFMPDDDDADDDELKQSRENIRASKKKNTVCMKNDEVNSEDDSGCDTEMDANGDGITTHIEVLEEEDDDVYSANSESDDSGGSFYYDSDDNCSYYSQTDEDCGDHALRRPSKMVYFDPMAVIPVFCCGMIFQNVQECRDALAKYAIMKGLQIHFIKNDQIRVRAGCMEKCPWRFLASKNDHDNNFTVKTYIPNHKCHRKNSNPMATSKFVAKILRERLMATPFIKLKDLHALCRIELKLKISLTQARNIRKNVIEDLLGSYEEEYKRLHDYVQEINVSNPGTTCVVKTSRDEGGDINHFKSFYVCFAACKKGWVEGCRKIIGLDGCFLKGVCKGQLLCAVGRDGNNQMFPIAWAVVAVENKENWGWFLNLLKYDLCIGEGEELTIVSDMQKGLDSAMKELLPQVEHRMCARHVYAAWVKKWKGGDRKIAFWSCAKSTFENDLKSKLRELQLLGNGIIEDFLRYNIESFSKAYFRTTPKCDVVDNNMSETFNGWILDARCKPIISMLEDIRTQVMRRLYIKRRFCTSWICAIGPRIVKKLEKNKELSFKWQIVWNGDDGYEVSNVYDRDNRHTVNLKSSTCTCREWDLTGIPCQHTVCALYSAKLEPEDYVAHWYTKATYLKAYQFMMQPVRGKILWAESGKDEIAPPPHRKLPGRPKVNRRKDKHEIKKIGTLSRKGRVMTCRICNQPGHNIRKCPKKTDKDGEGNPKKNGEGNTRNVKRKTAETSESTRSNPSKELVQEFVKNKNKGSNKGRVRPNKVLSGYGCYVNEKTGEAILNPGTKSMRSLHTESTVKKTHPTMIYSTSQQSLDASKNVPRSENHATTSLKWKGKAAVTTRQLQVEAQHRVTSFVNQDKGRD